MRDRFEYPLSTPLAYTGPARTVAGPVNGVIGQTSPQVREPSLATFPIGQRLNEETLHRVYLHKQHLLAGRSIVALLQL